MGVQGYSNDAWQAEGITDEGSYSPTQLFTAEDAIKTASGTFANDQDIAVLTIIARDASNEIVPWDPTATVAVVGGATDQTAPAPEATPIGVAAADMDTTSSGYNAATSGPYYISGCFNPDLLVWPAGLAAGSNEDKAGALETAGAPFRVKHLL